MNFKYSTYFYGLVLSISLAIPSMLRGQYGHVDHWETAIYASEVWKYHVGLTPPDSNWNGRFFVDTAWASGKGGIGYGDGDDSTIIPKTTSLYMRKVFTIQDTAILQAAVLGADYDDAFVAYLNGFEITREGIGKPWHEPKYTDTADYPREAELYSGGKYSDFIIHPNSVRNFARNGDNVLAIQVHNFHPNSSDMSAWFNLYFGIKNEQQQFAPAPKWFERPPLFSPSTTLPIVYIDVDTTINDSQKVAGTMKIIFHGKNQEHFFDEKPNNYDGRVAIKYRGNSSLQFPKKSFSFETQTSLGANYNVSLMGFQPENDWVLYAPYMDKSLLRNQLAYKVTYKTDAIGVRTQPCEVFRNGYYIGVYYLMEKVKRDDFRVDIKKMTPADTVGDNLTGGYMLKVDWLDTANDKSDFWFYNHHPEPYEDFKYNAFQYYEPSPEAMQPAQKEYIKNWMRDFETVLLSDNFKDPVEGYSKYIDISTFSDYLISREFGKELDSYRYSVYMYKDHKKDGGKLNMGPTWDFNIGFGNVDFGSERAELPRGWMYNQGGTKLFWFEHLMDDRRFADITNCRYFYYRSNVLSDENVNRILDETIAEMGLAADRNHYNWKTLGRYVWPNHFVGDTYQEEIDYLKVWVQERLDWMDINMPGHCQIPLTDESIEDNGLTNFIMYPNPATNSISFQSSVALSEVKIFDLGGRVVLEKMDVSAETNSISISSLIQGVYIVNVKTIDGELLTRKLVVQ